MSSRHKTTDLNTKARDNTSLVNNTLKILIYLLIKYKMCLIWTTLSNIKHFDIGIIKYDMVENN